VSGEQLLATVLGVCPQGVITFSRMNFLRAAKSCRRFGSFATRAARTNHGDSTAPHKIFLEARFMVPRGQGKGASGLGASATFRRAGRCREIPDVCVTTLQLAWSSWLGSQRKEREAKRAVELRRSRDAFEVPQNQSGSRAAYAWTGEKDQRSTVEQFPYHPQRRHRFHLENSNPIGSAPERSAFSRF